MEREVLVASILLWVNVMSFNLPYCWDPVRQMWKINQMPAPDERGDAYIVPPEYYQTTANSPLPQPPGTTCTDKCHKNWQVAPNDTGCDCCSGQDLIVVDTDGDAADAMALSMILNSTRTKSFTVAGITCTRGKTGIRNVAKNVVKTLKASNRLCQIPVYAGSDYELVEAKDYLSEYGQDAFGDFYYFPEVDEEICAEHPAIFIANLVCQNPGRVKVVCTGPLCNIAIAAHLHSDFYKDVKEILYLGGSMHDSGKYEGASENDLMDPYASMAVLNREPLKGSEGPKITICIDECHKDTYFEWDWRDELSKKGTAVMNLLNFAESKKLRNRDGTEGWNCDSPFLAAALLDPNIVLEEEFGRCSVAAPSGKVQIDTNDPNPNVRVIKKIDESKFKEMISKCL